MERLSPAPGLSLQPLSVPGRFFAFVADPPAVLQLDANSVLVIRLCELTAGTEEAIARYGEAVGMAETAARSVFTTTADELADAGVLVRSA
jgi:hypothetical protein